MSHRELLKKLADSLFGMMNAALRLECPGADVDSIGKLELAEFLFYLSASDGVIKPSEADLITYLTGLEVTPEVIASYIREHNTYSTEFETTIPLCVRAAVAIEKNNPSLSGGVQTMLKGYETIGNAFIEVDGDIDSEEQNNLSIYMNTLNTYVNRNSLSDQGTRAAKFGVSAPSKR